MNNTEFHQQVWAESGQSPVPPPPPPPPPDDSDIFKKGYTGGLRR